MHGRLGFESHIGRTATLGIGLLLAACGGSVATPSESPPRPTSGISTPSQQPATSAEPEPVEATLRLDFRTTGSHAGSFMALESGFFEDEGLTITIEDGEGSATTTQVVGTGGDLFGWADASVVALNITEGVPVVMVADVLQQSPALVLSRADDPVDEPSDLEGKSVGVTVGGSAEQMLNAFITVNAVDGGSIELVNMQGSAQPAAFLSGQVDVLVTSVGTALATTRQAEEQGFDTQTLMFSDHGVNLLAHGYIVSDETAEGDPELVQRFIRAALRGWEAVADDPQAGVDAITANRPEADPELLRDQLDVFLGQFHTANTENCPIGWQSSDDWEVMLDFLTDYSGMSTPESLDEYFSNEYLPNPTC